jgi:hypothetical protein
MDSSRGRRRIVCGAQTGTALAPQAVRPGTLLVDNTINRHFGFFIRPDLGFGYMTSGVDLVR